MQNKVQLITYVDRFGGSTFAELRELLDGPLAGVFGGVHVLPFFHPIDGADAGFDPIDHTQVDARLGTWADVAALARRTPLMADVIVNHVSASSPQFQDFLRHGERSAHAGLFLTLDAVFPEGAREGDLLAIYRPRPGLPFTCTTLASGEKKLLWTTFTPQQIDIDVRHPHGRAYLRAVLGALAAGGVTMIRLDAVGYAIKRPGTSCFMTPQTFAFIDEFAGEARGLGLEVLVEVHSYYRQQIEIARRVDWVYDFALPPLVLHALFFGRSGPLAEWIARRPVNAVTVLDTHDGIGIIDIGADAADRVARPGLVPQQELDRLVETIHANSGGASRAATGAAAANLDLYQVNCSFYDALGRDDRAYLLARALQFFLPGVPQVYYVGLLAGHNDLALLESTGVGRDINRHRYSRAEVLAQLERPVVRDLVALIRLRNEHPAFGGRFSAEVPAPERLVLRWEQGAHRATLQADLARRRFSIALDGPGGTTAWAAQVDGSAAD
jgi:sucrose phosphorylase